MTVSIDEKKKPEDRSFPKVVPSFDESLSPASGLLYSHSISEGVKRLIAPSLFSSPSVSSGQLKKFIRTLPFFTLEEKDPASGELSFLLLCKSTPDACKFFYDIISRFLLPGKELRVLTLFASGFCFEGCEEEKFEFCEMIVKTDCSTELEGIRRNFAIIETYIRLGVTSKEYAKRILEVLGLAPEEKTAMIHNYIASLIRRMPQDIDEEILSEMQHALVSFPNDFKKIRGYRHLAKLITIQYLFRKELKEEVARNPGQRFLSLKLFRAKLREEGGERPVVALLVGLNFLEETEVFEKYHLLKAVQGYVPNAIAIEDSFFAAQQGGENIKVFYLEIEKQNGEAFTSAEFSAMRGELPSDLKDRIKHLLHPVFMPRNEEEIVRNILSLSNQIRYLRDVPQVFISFDEQTHSDLLFSVIVVWVHEPGGESIQEKFNRIEGFAKYIHDRCKLISFMRKKYVKEATVFRLQFKKESFLRADHSIDLCKARQAVVMELERVIGSFRDYNGGMISKQTKLLSSLRGALEGSVRYDELLLENFFYSVTPVVMRTVLEVLPLKQLFLLFQHGMEEEKKQQEEQWCVYAKDSKYVYAIVCFVDEEVKEKLETRLRSLCGSKLTTTAVSVHEVTYYGYLYSNDNEERAQQFCELLKAEIPTSRCQGANIKKNN